MRVRYLNGGSLGLVEERFVSRVRPGERFVFAGRVLELVSIRDMDVRVRAARGSTDHVPKWTGGRLPLSDSLAGATERLFVELRDALASGQDLADFGVEVGRAADLLRRQAAVSRLPGGRVLAEVTETREGSHLILFPFGGQLANEGLAALLAARLGADAAAPRAAAAPPVPRRRGRQARGTQGAAPEGAVGRRVDRGAGDGAARARVDGHEGAPERVGGGGGGGCVTLQRFKKINVGVENTVINGLL